MNGGNFVQKIVFIAAALTLSVAAVAEPLSGDLQAKVDKYKIKLVEWAANPAVVAAVKEANAKGGVTMSNAKWDELADNDAAVQAYVTGPVGKQLAKWEEDKNISKLYLRDAKGNLVAASNKPLLFNNVNRPAFANSFKAVWAANEIKPDPTTQKKSVQLGVPVLDGGKPIGVLHSAIDSQ
jgi:C4-dicarboxylate-specific signal transduction histidine kinase